MIKKAKFTSEFREEALDLASRIGIQEAARQLDIHLNTIISWKKKFERSGVNALHNRSRLSQPHPNRKISEKCKNSIIQLKSEEPKITYQEIIDRLKLNCSIPIICKILKPTKLKITFRSQNFILTYKVKRNGFKLVYIFILTTPFGSFFAEHYDLDIDYLTKCINYWLKFFHKFKLLTKEVNIDITSLYLVTRNYNSLLIDKQISSEYEVNLISNRRNKYDLKINFEDYQKISLSAYQFLYNFKQTKLFYAIPSPTFNLTTNESYSEQNLIIAILDLIKMADSLFDLDNLIQSELIYDLIIIYCKTIDDKRSNIYRHSLLKKAQVVSYNQSFFHAEKILLSLINDSPDDIYSLYSWSELGTLYQYAGNKELSIKAIFNAEKLAKKIVHQEPNNPKLLLLQCNIAVIKKDTQAILATCEKILELPNSIEYIQYKCLAIFEKGCAYYNLREYHTSFDLFNEILNNYSSSVPDKIKAKIYYNFGQYAFVDNNLEECHRNIQYAISLSEKIGYQLLLARCRQIMVFLYVKEKHYNLAISNSLHCYEIFTNLGYVKDICRTCYQLSEIYQYNDQTNLQLRWLKELLKISKTEKIHVFIGLAYDMFCSYYSNKYNYKLLAKYSHLLSDELVNLEDPFFEASAKTYLAISSIGLNHENAMNKITEANNFVSILLSKYDLIPLRELKIKLESALSINK
ncbi:MAG: hypothetical protein JXR48_05935 [Candidatus Delongbacteria bacterium]|nr:hypothetical protein [Candidatus Delongbacteria bacterium]MBN2834490.1 hypothetical protein [Candidatus Delongbacteria bacterium]